jgi:hypothetical protein
MPLSLLLFALVLTKLAARARFNRLDIVPAFGQIYTWTPAARTLVALRILHPFSHFRAAVARIGFGFAIAHQTIGQR